MKFKNISKGQFRRRNGLVLTTVQADLYFSATKPISFYQMCFEGVMFKDRDQTVRII